MNPLTLTVERKRADLPRYVVLSTAQAHALGVTGTAILDCAFAGLHARRSLKRWDEARWFFELPDALCKRAGIDTGDVVTFTLSRADESIPEPLRACLDAEPSAWERWRALSEAQRRQTREHVRAAAREATRARRARHFVDSLVRREHR